MEAYTLDWQKGQLIQDRMQEANYKRISDKKIDDTMKVQIMNLKEYEQIKEYIPHKKNLLYSMNHVRYCKVDSFHDCVQGIMRVPDLKNHEMFVFGFCMYKQTLYFVEETNQIQLLMEHVKNDVYKNCRLHEVLLMLLNYLIDDDVYRMQKIEEQLEKIEENVIGHVQKHLDERIMKYRKHFSELMVSYDQMTNMGEHMQLYMNRNEIQDEEMGWERYVHRTERLHQYAAEMKEYTQQIREIYQTQITLQQNRVMNFLTVVTTIFMPLTLITGWYGMNFYNMQELHWQYGYICVIIISIVVIIAECIYFKKKKML